MVVYHARKTAARRIARHTGMTYTAALRYMAETRDRQPRYRWILTDPVRRFLGGEDWVGLRYKNLYDWLDQLDPIYRCTFCGTAGDVRHQDSSIRLRAIRYDPDLSPRTWLRDVEKYHAECVSSDVVWCVGADVPDRPEELKVTLLGFQATFDLHAIAVTAPDSDRRGAPMLIITADLVEGDSIDSLSSWDLELGCMLEKHGFRVRSGPERGPLIPVWSIRATPGDVANLQPSWVALRNSPVKAGAITKHLYLSEVPRMTPQWLDQAAAAGEVEVIVKPRTGHERVPLYAARVALDTRSWGTDTPVPTPEERRQDVLEDTVYVLYS